MPWYQRWRNVFRPERVDEALEDELQYHIAETVDRLVEKGMPEREALREARRRLGNYGLQKERTRDMNLSQWLDSTRADILYAIRQLRLNPGFAAVAVVSLALGIGANSAMFQLVNAIRLKLLPVSEPEQLAYVDFQRPAARSGWFTGRSSIFTYAQWDQIRTHQETFTGMFAWNVKRFNLSPGGEPRFAQGMFASGGMFDVLGVKPMLGRTFNEADDGPHCNASAVLSHAFWQREFGGDPTVIGRIIKVDGYPLPVSGVTGPAFFGLEVGSQFDIAVPLCTDALLAEDHKGRAPLPAAWWLSVMGRLKPGATIARANAGLLALSPAVMRATLPPEYAPGLAKRYLANKLTVTEGATGISDLRRQYERPLWILMAITGLVLLIACANLANLLLARATAREREIAVRLAIGASRARLVRQLLAESLLLAFAGAISGTALAALMTRAMTALISTPDAPVFVDVTPDWRVLLFTSGLAIATCLLFGLLPAMRATVLAPATAMRAGGRGMTAGRERFNLRRGLVALQVALSFVLLTGALLFVRTLNNLSTADAGFQSEGVLSVNLDISKAPYKPEQRLALYQQFQETLAALPGVISAAQVGSTPVSGSTWDQMIGADGARATESGNRAFFNRSAQGYFHTMGTPLLSGRDFNSHDTLTSEKVAVVNEMFARRFFGGRNPVGHTFRLDAGAGKPEPSFLIVGMVANTKYAQLREDFLAIAHFPIAQDPEPGAGATFVLRLTGPPGAVMDRANKAIGQINAQIGIEYRPFSVQLQESLLREKLMATLSGGFGILAGLLSTLGLYGVIAYMVARRRNEIGLRMALGASRGHITAVVLREAAVLVFAGLAAGLLLVLWAGRTAETLLYGLAANDVSTLAVAGAVLAGVALLASYLPSRRAAAIDPIAALREE